MDVFLFWFGLAHLAAYAVAGFSLAFARYIDWVIPRYAMKADIIRAVVQIYKDRKAAGE